MTMVRQRVQVLPGHRVELVAPELNDGDWVEVLIHSDPDPKAARPNVITFLDSLPPGPRAAASWDEYEQLLHEERASWER